MAGVMNRIACAGLLMLFLGMWPAGARGEDDFLAGATTLEDEVVLFQEIESVYGASKYEQKVTEAPSSVSIVTAEEIKKYGHRTFSDILRSVRGFHATNDRNYQYAGVRGFGLPTDYNNRILVLIDGHKVNDNIYDSVVYGTGFPIDIDLIDRLEIIRGPGSALYGSNAFFAVVNVITKNGAFYDGVEASGEAGSHDTYEGRLTLGTRFQGGFEGLLSGTYFDSDGDDRLFFKEFDDPATNNGIAEDLDGDTAKTAFLELKYHDLTLRGLYTYRKKDVPTAPYESEFNERTTTTDEQAYLNLKYERELDWNTTVTALAGYNYYSFEGTYPYFWGPPDPPIVDNLDSADGQWLDLEVQAVTGALDRQRIIVGVEYQYNFQQDQKNEDENIAVNLEDERDLDNWGVYIQDEITVTDQLLLTAGIRYDHYDSFGGTTNPRAALVYTPFEKTALKAVYGRAFRAPSVYELYYNDAGFSQKSNPDLDAETIDTYELIYEQYVGDRVRGTIVGFYYEIDDLITFTEDPADICGSGDPCVFFDNVEEVEAIGVEVEVEGKTLSGYEGRISYSFQETEDKTTGRILTNSPKHLAKLNAVIPLWREKVFLGIEEQYTYKRRTLADDRTDDFFVTNVTLFSQNIVEDLELSASVYNLFDEEYGDPGGEEHEQDIIEQDGRTFRVKLTYVF